MWSFVCVGFSLFSSVQSLSHVRLLATLWVATHQASLSISNSRVYSNSCPLNRWCHPAISSSVVPFSSCPQSLPASGSFPMSQLFLVTLFWLMTVWGWDTLRDWIWLEILTLLGSQGPEDSDSFLWICYDHMSHPGHLVFMHVLSNCVECGQSGLLRFLGKLTGMLAHVWGRELHIWTGLLAEP